MQESITRRIKSNYSYLAVGQIGRVLKEKIEKFFGDIPKKSYRVRYVLDGTGPYRVERYASFYPHIVDITTGRKLFVCFLPESWDGMRVCREVLPW